MCYDFGCGNLISSRNVTNCRLKIDSDFAKLHSEISNKITKSYSIVAFSTSEILEVNRINSTTSTRNNMGASRQKIAKQNKLSFLS